MLTNLIGFPTECTAAVTTLYGILVSGELATRKAEGYRCVVHILAYLGGVVFGPTADAGGFGATAREAGQPGTGEPGDELSKAIDDLDDVMARTLPGERAGFAAPAAEGFGAGFGAGGGRWQKLFALAMKLLPLLL